MIRALWFLAKTALLIGAVLWVAEQPGTVRVEWLETTITIHVGLFMAGLLGIILLSIFIYGVIRGAADLPARYRHHAKTKAREKGYRALTLGLTAVAAGDTKAAIRESKRARSLLPDDKGLPLLLEAQSARLDGREGDAQKAFVALLDNKDAAFLGVRGLLQSSIESGDYGSALKLARKALALHPKQKWILRSVYDLEVRGRHWSNARDILARAVKAKAISKERAQSDKVAMALALALEAQDQGLDEVVHDQLKKAYRLDGTFIPGVIMLAQYYAGKGQRKKAVALVERVWRKTPHAALVTLWGGLMDEKVQKTDALSRLRWYERLVKLNTEHAAGHLAAGVAAMDGGLWGEARAHFTQVEKLQPSAALYKALAKLEEKAAGNEEAARVWLEKAADADGDKVWVCRESGRVYDFWRPIALPHGSFNTIEWAEPHGPIANYGEFALTEGRDFRDLDDTLIEVRSQNSKVA